MEKELKELLLLWQAKAENDLKVVKKELASDDPITDIVCFHCQQAAEKYLKLYLLSKGSEPRKTHLLSDLLKECLAYEENFKLLQDTLFLSEYAVEIRYPDEYYMPTKEECQKALLAAQKIKEVVLKLM